MHINCRPWHSGRAGAGVLLGFHSPRPGVGLKAPPPANLTRLSPAPTAAHPECLFTFPPEERRAPSGPQPRLPSVKSQGEKREERLTDTSTSPRPRALCRELSECSHLTLKPPRRQELSVVQEEMPALREGGRLAWGQDGEAHGLAAARSCPNAGGTLVQQKPGPRPGCPARYLANCLRH